MSISGAMNTGVSGLFANSEAVRKISENIANANTVGYKRSFAQMVTATAGGPQATAGVRTEITSEIGKDGALIATNSVTDMAITGDGFFVVSRTPDAPNPADYRLTRAGSFLPDENGNLVNAAGYYLAGFAYQDDGTLGVVDQNSFAQLGTVNVANLALDAEASTAMSVRGNLPAQETGLATPGSPFVSSSAFYTPLGAESRVSLSWQPTATANRWDVTISDDGGTDYGQVTVDFADSGPTAGAPLAYGGVTPLAAPPAGFAFDPLTGIATLTIDNGATPQTLEIALGAPGSFAGITQFAGDFTPQDFAVDGSPVADVARTEMDDAGNIFAVYENGSRRAVYQVPLATVTNPGGLYAEDGNAYRLSQEAGDLAVQAPGRGGAGVIRSANLENSNVDIAQELTDMITVQRAYSSNAKIITTADAMLEETTRLKR